MKDKIRVAILDDHQIAIEGYKTYLNAHPQIEVVATMNYGDDLEPTLAQTPVDVLLLDVEVPNSRNDSNSYPIHHVIPKLLEAYPGLSILVISVHAERGLVHAVMDAGASGYILKGDNDATRELGNIVVSVARNDGRYLTNKALDLYMRHLKQEEGVALAPRQREILSLCASYPNKKEAEFAKMIGISNSTARNILSKAYVKLKVNSRAAAVAKAQKMGIIAPELASPLRR